MKKPIFSMAILLALLAGCSSSSDEVKAKKDSNGQIMATYTVESTKTNIYADELYNKLLETNDGTIKLFDAIYKEVIEKLISEEDLEIITSEVKEKMKTWVQDAKDQAKTNGVAQDVMIDSLLENEGVETIAELQEKNIYTKVKEKVEEKYYTDRRDGYIADYVKEYYPFHLRGILVKVSDSTNSLFARSVSETEAKKLENVFTQLRNGEDFSVLAGKSTISDHSSSQINAGGSFGIMDATEAYNYEFKYGVYSYVTKDAAFNNVNSEAIATTLGLTDDFKAIYDNGVNIITQAQIEELTKAIELKDKLVNGENAVKSTREGDYQSTTIARSIVFNNYFNNHSISFIEASANTKHVKTIGYANKNGVVGPVNVVATSNGEPVIVLTDENGVQFIAIDNNPFVDTKLTTLYYSASSDKVYYAYVNTDLVSYATEEEFKAAHPTLTPSVMIPYISQGFNAKSDRKDKIDTRVKNYINKEFNSSTSANLNFFRYSIFNESYADPTIVAKLKGFGEGEKAAKFQKQVENIITSEVAYRNLQIYNAKIDAWDTLEDSLKLQHEQAVNIRPLSLIDDTKTDAELDALLEYWRTYLYGSTSAPR